MQNKNILVVFTVLLALATLYTLSFNWVASGYEATADEYGAYVADSLETPMPSETKPSTKPLLKLHANSFATVPRQRSTRSSVTPTVT